MNLPDLRIRQIAPHKNERRGTIVEVEITEVGNIPIPPEDTKIPLISGS
ncbi:Transporter [Brevibacillus sp. IT-7CA2]